jgi:hypothetical protein
VENEGIFMNMEIRVITLALLGGISLYATPSFAGDEYPRPPQKPPLEARAEVGLRPGTERSIALTEFWVPIAQNPTDGSVIYGDLRMMGDDQDNREFNVGFGYRKMVQSTLTGHGIVGGHVWYDRRLTNRGSAFNQVTAGMEWFSDVWDAKINAYLPLNDSKTHVDPNPNGAGGGFVGNQIVVNTDQTSIEEALKGLDLELGMKVSFLDDVTDSTRVYGGVYHFEGDRAESVSGWRARISSDISSDMQVGARFQRDDVRGSQGFLEATIRFPFGNKQSYQSQGLYARLDESPERDIDIVSNEVVTDAGLNVPLTNAATGASQEIFHVDNTAAPGGDGSNERRFNTLAAAQAAAGANDIIYVHRGDGASTGMNSGITLSQSGQMLIGSGTDLTFDNTRFGTNNGSTISSTTIIPKTSAPLITNTGGDGVRVNADRVTVSGLRIDSPAGDGVEIINRGNISITHNVIVGAGDNGIRGNFNNISSTLNVVGNQVSNAGNGGLDTGIFFTLSTNANMIVNIANNVVENSFARGIWLAGVQNSLTTSLVDRNIVRDNSSLGIVIETQNTAIQTTTVTGNISFKTALGVQSTGIGFASYFDYAGTQPSTSRINGILKDNITYGNTMRGIDVQTGSTGSQINLSIEGNQIYSNLIGLYLSRTGSSTQGVIELKASSNSFISNLSHGVYIDDDSSESWAIDLGGGALGSTGGNSIFGNTGTDIRVDLDGEELKAENNWWGVSNGLAGGDLTLEVGSTIDTDPFLTSAP